MIVNALGFEWKAEADDWPGSGDMKRVVAAAYVTPRSTQAKYRTLRKKTKTFSVTQAQMSLIAVLK